MVAAVWLFYFPLGRCFVLLVGYAKCVEGLVGAGIPARVVVPAGIRFTGVVFVAFGYG